MQYLMHHAGLGDPLSLSAAFVVGLAGSVHCLAMCGGISGALGMRARGASTPRRAAALTACHQTGRLCSYALAGAIVGVFSALMQGMADLDYVALIARILAGLVLAAIGAGIALKWRPLVLERLGARLWSRLSPLARIIPPHGAAGALLLGMLWGWLPCGFVYSMLIFAALKGGALQAAALMFVFGLGTIPAVFGAGLLSAEIGRISVARGVHAAAGWLLLVFGVLTIVGPFSSVHH
ncbi:MAG TPA: sulfite exporter TauE/SafE family protein [Steroidobacteraceae bacterium]|nr:sulfite exporter TauE/SafE family protein [Steroidobacteraceae bacterium]